MAGKKLVAIISDAASTGNSCLCISIVCVCVCVAVVVAVVVAQCVMWGLYRPLKVVIFES